MNQNDPAANTEVATTKRKLPTLDELHHDPVEAFKNDELNLLLNQEPRASWLKVHPFITTKNPVTGATEPYRYLPIDKIEFLLTKIFQKWEVEILREGVMFQSVYVAVRLKVLNPVNGQWIINDGIAAVGIQTDKGQPASNLAAIKTDAVMKALPAAESYAVKDAAEKLGKLFGKDLQRKDTMAFAGAYSDAEKIKELAQQIKDAK